jgi:hypothetical protein
VKWEQVGSDPASPEQRRALYKFLINSEAKVKKLIRAATSAQATALLDVLVEISDTLKASQEAQTPEPQQELITPNELLDSAS